MNLTSYMQQHKDIAVEMKAIQDLLNGTDIESKADEIAKHMCQFAGKVKVHLSSEDDFLYPYLAKSQDENVRQMAVRYQKQMGSIAEKFIAYKDKYNTKQKVLANIRQIKIETNTIFRELENRIRKEETELYLHI